jgi:hypothetical protein
MFKLIINEALSMHRSRHKSVIGIFNFFSYMERNPTNYLSRIYKPQI